MTTATKTIARFALESHAGPYESWPLKSRLIADGVMTETRVGGYSLLHQYEIADGFLLVTDYDCLFEEATEFTLLDRELNVLASHSICGPYCTFLLDNIEWIDERNLIAEFHDHDRWKVTISHPNLPLLRWRITAKRIKEKA